MEMARETEISTELGVLSFGCETCQNSDQGAFHDPEEASGSSQWAFPGADKESGGDCADGRDHAGTYVDYGKVRGEGVPRLQVWGLERNESPEAELGGCWM